jgi:hypothetical protein
VDAIDVEVIDVNTAVQLLGECVQESGPDFVYQPKFVARHHYTTCVYSYDGEPDCLVGHFLARCGVPAAALAALGDDDIRSLYVAGRLPVRLSNAALALLQQVQESQDRQLPWSQALRTAGVSVG